MKLKNLIKGLFNKEKTSPAVVESAGNRTDLGQINNILGGYSTALVKHYLSGTEKPDSGVVYKALEGFESESVRLYARENKYPGKVFNSLECHVNLARLVAQEAEQFSNLVQPYYQALVAGDPAQIGVQKELLKEKLLSLGDSEESANEVLKDAYDIAQETMKTASLESSYQIG